MSVSSNVVARRPQRRSTGLAGRLNAEWHAHVAAEVSRALGGWAAAEAALDLVDATALEAAASQRDNDEVLRALLRLHRDGDALAGRALLQLCLGVALGLARRTVHHAGGDHEESEARAVAGLVDVLAVVPLTARSRLVDRVALDLLGRLTRESRRALGEHAVGTAVDVEVAGGSRATAAGPHGRPVDELPRADLAVLHLLVEGTRGGVLRREDAVLLWDVHSPGGPGGIEELARARGMAGPALRQRVSRARRRLVAALAVSVATPQVSAA
ncbi:hypothetical protein [Aquipuribacter nitratireducens]|uniref:Uncharacterized protein n=1 Tax=Aquipuribacter nitratireducens TaxID=650104 RepID=A0ABW0GPE2_9MICO